MEQLIVLIIFGVIAVINWLVKKGSETPGSTGKNLPPFPRGNTGPATRRPSSTDSEEERLRKFREALGIPANAEPPPRRVVRPQNQVPPTVPTIRRPQPPAAPKVQPARPEKVPPMPMPAAAPQYVPPAWETPEADFPTDSSVELVPMAMAPAPVVQGQAAATGPIDFKFLKSRSSLRTAIILREVLGPPKALQPLTGGTPDLL